MISKSPTLEAMKAEAIPGRCICCDLPIQKRGWKCTDPECVRLYMRVYQADWIARRRAERRGAK